MMDHTTVEKNLQQQGITLPEPSSAVANYVGFQRIGSMIIISGQLPMKDGSIVYKGHLGTDIDLDNGYAAARLCTINILAQLKKAIHGDWSKVKQCVRLGGFVAATADFTDHPKVINGASDLMVAILGDAGRHARAAVGVSSLPLGACVEVEAMFEIT